VTKNMARMWNKSFASLRDDERGAESTEIIFILVIVVLGLAGAFIALKEALSRKATGITDCIGGIDAADANCAPAASAP
jgi:Flp pilus assembly pilin Flp